MLRRGCEALLLLACLAFAVRLAVNVVAFAQVDYPAFNDFFAQWSFARFAQAGHAASIYDGAALHRFQLTLAPRLRQFYPFPYPPSYLFVVWPVGWLPFGSALAVWEVGSLALFVWAVFGGAWRTRLVGFVVLAPASTLALEFGQNGLLVSALIVAGMRLMRQRPIVGGVLLGLATVKPQLGVLLPFALIASRRWGVLAAACAAALALVVASGLAFGWELWPGWLRAMGIHASYVQGSVSQYMKPTIMATLTIAGTRSVVGYAIQGGAGVAVAVVVWWCFRRGADDMSIAALQVGTYLATPYVFTYDLPMLTNAMLLCLRRRKPGLIDGGILAAGLLFPAVVTLTTRFYYAGSVSLLALLGLAVWRRWREPGGRTP